AHPRLPPGPLRGQLRLPGHARPDAPRAGPRRLRPARRLPGPARPRRPVHPRQALQPPWQPAAHGRAARPPAAAAGRRPGAGGSGGAMTFTERPFWVLTAATFALWLVCRRSSRATVALLLGASVVFYGYHSWPLLSLVLAYCFVDWLAACRLARSRRPGAVLALGVTFNLAVLAYWKYTPMLLRTAA